MKRLKVALWIGWSTFLVSWFLPIHELGETLADGVLPGWLVARDCLAGEGGVHGFVSALTNIVMLVTAPVALFRSRKAAALLAGLCIVGALVNGWWIIRVMPDGGLRIGYYLWSLSFVIVAAGMWQVIRRQQPDEPSEAPVTA